MLKNHNFEPGDIIVFLIPYQSRPFTKGKHYKVIEAGLFSLKITNDEGVEEWMYASCFDHVPIVTITRKHLKRITFVR